MNLPLTFRRSSNETKQQGYISLLEPKQNSSLILKIRYKTDIVSAAFWLREKFIHQNNCEET